MDQNQIKELFNHYPIYTDIMIGFYNHYELGENYDVDHFIATVNKFNHPEDREILFGQVLRKVIRDQVMNDPHSTDQQKNDVKDYNLVSDELVGKLANQMGASLTIHATEKPSDFDLHFPEKNSSWNIDIYHTERGGGHYNFSYPEKQLNAIHNALYIKDDYGRRLPSPQSSSLLFDKSNIVGVNEQDKAIRQDVQHQYKTTLLAQKPTMVQEQARPFGNAPTVKMPVKSQVEPTKVVQQQKPKVDVPKKVEIPKVRSEETKAEVEPEVTLTLPPKPQPQPKVTLPQSKVAKPTQHQQPKAEVPKKVVPKGGSEKIKVEVEPEVTLTLPSQKPPKKW